MEDGELVAWTSGFDPSPESLPPAAIRPERTNVEDFHLDDLDIPDRMDGSGPLVSVIIPTFGDAVYLRDALESVGAQTHSNIEVVIVDSSNVPCIADLSRHLPWILHHPVPPRGVSHARNEGIEAASGEFVAFLDADDYWHPHKLERQLAAIGSDVDSSFCGYYFLNYWVDDGPEIRMRDVDRVDPRHTCDALVRRTIDAHISTLLARASALRDRPFIEDFEHFEDVTFAIELFQSGSAVHVPAALAVRRLRTGSLADRTDERVKSEARIDAYHYLAAKYPELSASAWAGIAGEQYRLALTCLEHNDVPTARTHLSEAFACGERLRASVVLAATYLGWDGVTILRVLDRTAGLYRTLRGASTPHPIGRFTPTEQ